MEALVNVEQVSRKYLLDHSHVTALEEVTLRVAPNEFIAVAGPSGSGKSTLLNLIGCIDRPSSGRIFIENIDVTALTPLQLTALRREKLGFVFQTFNLIPVFTAWENVEYPLLLRRMSERERRRRVEEALNSVGLAERARHRPDLLSGGERQRVAVARAIVHCPALILADEPTANLDTANATHLIELMRDLNRRLGLTFIFSTHDQRLLKRADRVAWLCDGKLRDQNVQEGNDAEVLAAGF
jgi:putative ABC transport system ATP-binding protein